MAANQRLIRIRRGNIADGRPQGLRGVVAASFVLWAFAATSCAPPVRHEGFEVKRGASVAEKLELAKATVTEERLARLKNELRDIYPTLTADHLSYLGVRWWHRWQFGAQNEGIVTVTVLMQDAKGIDVAAVVHTAARILDREINGPNSAYTKEP